MDRGANLPPVDMGTKSPLKSPLTMEAGIFALLQVGFCKIRQTTQRQMRCKSHGCIVARLDRNRLAKKPLEVSKIIRGGFDKET